MIAIFINSSKQVITTIRLINGINNNKDGVMNNNKDGVMNNNKDGVMNNNKDGVMNNNKDGVMNMRTRNKEMIRRQTK